MRQISKKREREKVRESEFSVFYLHSFNSVWSMDVPSRCCRICWDPGCPSRPTPQSSAGGQQDSLLFNLSQVHLTEKRPADRYFILKYTVCLKRKTWTQLWANDIYWKIFLQITVNLFIWTKTSFALARKWNKQSLKLHNKLKLNIAHMQNLIENENKSNFN